MVDNNQGRKQELEGNSLDEDWSIRRKVGRNLNYLNEETRRNSLKVSRLCMLGACAKEQYSNSKEDYRRK